MRGRGGVQQRELMKKVGWGRVSTLNKRGENKRSIGRVMLCKNSLPADKTEGTYVSGTYGHRKRGKRHPRTPTHPNMYTHAQCSPSPPTAPLHLFYPSLLDGCVFLFSFSFRVRALSFNCFFCFHHSSMWLFA